MMESIQKLDEKLFIFLNQLNAELLDPIMLALTGRFIWVPFYMLLLYFLIKEFKKESIWYILGLAFVILLADQFTSGFMKPFFERLRPCHDPRWDDLIFNYAGCGGRFGFASSHAANTFALAAYLNLVAGNKIPGYKWLFLWAAVVSYTRIYLGVHYPLDILIGALVGLASGWIIWMLVIYLKKSFANNPGAQ
ncbi:MAG: phosphatase PAP2 family protein [Cyclobacteriaceae bacterium]